ncbi:hypothetical protein F5884DRAFT_756428 [Xylogone sp. PMI_703]|nr:hypothetical protein F5884DRAFT_756428 [Xylogone sp. PMI_703]
MSDQKISPLHSESETTPRSSKIQNTLSRHTPAVVICSNIIALIFIIIINVGALHTIPTSGFIRDYTNYHILEFTALLGSTTFDVYGIRFYLNGVWTEPQYSGSDSDAVPLYKDVGRAFDVNAVIARLSRRFSGTTIPGPIKVDAISTSAPFVLYILGTATSLALLLVWGMNSARISSGRHVPSDQKRRRFRMLLAGFSNISLILILAATAYLTAHARHVADVINRQPDSSGVKDAGLGQVFLGLAWGSVGAQVINSVLLTKTDMPKRVFNSLMKRRDVDSLFDPTNGADTRNILNTSQCVMAVLSSCLSIPYFNHGREPGESDPIWRG